MRAHKALTTLVAALMLDFCGGVVFAVVEHLPTGLGLYWALTTATTVGYGDISPHTTVGHVIAALVMLTVVPLFAATYSLLTSGLTAAHVHSENARVRQRLDHIIHHHPDIPDLAPDLEEGKK